MGLSLLICGWLTERFTTTTDNLPNDISPIIFFWRKTDKSKNHSIFADNRPNFFFWRKTDKSKKDSIFICWQSTDLFLLTKNKPNTGYPHNEKTSNWQKDSKMATVQKPDIILSITDLDDIRINNDSSPESSPDKNLTTKIENANRLPIQPRQRKRVTLSTVTRKISCDNWVDINENIIKEQDENSENQKTDYEISTSSASSQRRKFSRRSFSTDGWVEQEVKHSHHHRFVAF